MDEKSTSKIKTATGAVKTGTGKGNGLKTNANAVTKPIKSSVNISRIRYEKAKAVRAAKAKTATKRAFQRDLKYFGKGAVRTAAANLDKQEDKGTAALSAGIKTARNSGRVFKLARGMSAAAFKATPTAVNTVSRGVNTVARISSGGTTVKKVVADSASNLKPIKFARETVRVVRGITSGGIVIDKSQTTKSALLSVGRGAAGVGKLSVKTGAKAISGGLALGDRLTAMSDDTGVQALNLGIKTAKAAPKAVKTAGRAIKTSVKRTIKTGRTAVKITAAIQKKGVKSAAKGAVKSIGKGIVNAFVNLLKGLLNKALIPSTDMKSALTTWSS